MKDYQKPEVLICRFLPEDLITVSTVVGAVENIKSQIDNFFFIVFVLHFIFLFNLMLRDSHL